MTWWLIGVLGYLAALGVVLALAGGVRRSDERHAGTARELDASSRETDPRDARVRAHAPPRASTPLREARTAARS